MGRSWAAVAAEEDPYGMGWDRNYTGRSGSRRRRGGRDGGGGGTGEIGGGVGAGVLNIENNGKIRWQPSLIGRLI